jgi:uncharacterized protein YodC (DUF2158 family)
MSQFKTGTVVQLKSGGPRMTCTGEPDPEVEGQVHCQWFAGAKLETGWFPPESLMVVDGAEASPDKPQGK